MANRLSHSLNEIESHTPVIKAQATENDVASKNGEQTEEGDHVYTRIRGERHEGNVSAHRSDSTTSLPNNQQQGKVNKIVTDQEEADAEDVKHPPKVHSYGLRKEEQRY